MTSNSKHFEFRKSQQPLPTFFFSHGGPTFADVSDKVGSNTGAYNKVREVGSYLKNEVKPDFIIVVSAHWLSDSPNQIKVSIPGEGEKDHVINGVQSRKFRNDENALVYDFYNFPQKFYDSQFHSITNQTIVDDIVKTLNESGEFNAETEERGIDHGVFVVSKIAFADDVDKLDSNKLDIDVPVIQVSLAGTPDIETHYKLGKILSKYRNLNGVLIFSGMSVHNLGEWRAPPPGANYDYSALFNNLLTNILSESDSSEVLKRLKELPNGVNKEIYERSHPTNEHFLPVVVGAGASLGEPGDLLYEDAVNSLGWNIYRWG